MLNERGSKEFWKQVAAVDAKHIAGRLNDMCVVGASQGTQSPPIDVFKSYFDSIGQPPSCEWFDDTFRDSLRAAVNLSVLGINAESEDTMNGDWIVDNSDIRVLLRDNVLIDVHGSHDGTHRLDNIMEHALHLTQARATLNALITIQELRQAKERMKTGKAVGIDGLPFELFRGQRPDDDSAVRQLTSELDEAMVHLFNLILTSGKYPDAWRLAVLVPLLKGVNLDSKLPTNYRGIALLSTVSKLFATILERRLTDFQWATGLISDAQFGFTRNRRTLDPAFILDTLVDTARASNTQLFATFIDFKKVYHFVPRDA
jgi:hypothetical protein